MVQQTTTITPLSNEQQQLVVESTQYYISMAEQLFDLKIKPVEITFNLKGRAAGMYRIQRSRKILLTHINREIRYNSLIFAKYFEDNIENTIPHEVAHYISDMLYGLKNIKPHGSEWKEIMLAFDADNSVTANYDLSDIPLKKQNTHTYSCACRQHQLSSIRHNRITKKHRQYFCKACKQTLQIHKPGFKNQQYR